MENTKIRWAAVQPLTGGMYLGTQNATGVPAQFILSYEGLNAIKKNRAGEEIAAVNEGLLQRYLEKHNDMVNYYNFVGRGMKDADMDVQKVEIKKIYEKDERTFEQQVAEGLDLVIAVPVCAGLSTFSAADIETRANCNNNQKFITKYTLEVLKPTVYVFENAPALFGGRSQLAAELHLYYNDIAAKYGYSITYLYTDSIFHHNAQSRKRTFVVMTKHRAGEIVDYKFQGEKVSYDLKEYLATIPENATQKDILCGLAPIDRALINYAKSLYGEDWRVKTVEEVGKNVIALAMKDKFVAFRKYLAEHASEYTEEEMQKTNRLIDHILDKAAQNKGAFLSTPVICLDRIGAVMNKTNASAIHPTEDRHFNVRELLTFMGLPFDYEIISGRDMPLIGQNVPVKTAEWVIRNVVNIIEQYDNLPTTDKNESYFNNVKED